MTEREPPLFSGHQPRECGEHRTAGPYRAWCYADSEWCYPDPGMACRGCLPVAADPGQPSPRVYTFTRDQLTEALTRHRPALRNPGTVAGALLEALEGGSGRRQLSRP